MALGSSTSARGTTMTHATRRYQRYRQIVAFMTARESFAIDDVKRGCPDETPAFVTRVVGELATDGWLLRASRNDERTDSDVHYRWNTERGEFPAGRWLDDKIFGSQIRESPAQERPRERLLADGAASLSTAELLAILIRSGRPGESAVEAGRKLSREFGDRLQDLPNAARGELKLVSCAVQNTAWCQIMAGIELGRRVAAASLDPVITKITSSAAAMELCRHRFQRLVSDARQEEFHIVTLDTKNQVIATHRITVGTLDASLVHPREVFRPAIKDAAAAVILVHNHPSGDATPSREDHAVTRRLESAGELLGIEVLDHIVLGRSQAVSIREHTRKLAG